MSPFAYSDSSPAHLHVFRVIRVALLDFEVSQHAEKVLGLLVDVGGTRLHINETEGRRMRQILFEVIDVAYDGHTGLVRVLLWRHTFPDLIFGHCGENIMHLSAI